MNKLLIESASENNKTARRIQERGFRKYQLPQKRVLLCHHKMEMPIKTRHKVLMRMKN